MTSEKGQRETGRTDDGARRRAPPRPGLRLLAAGALLALLSACQLPNPYRAPAPPVPAPAPAPEPPRGEAPRPPAEQPRPAPPTREYRLSPATQSLVTQARAQSARGEFEAAASTLDRAIRIEPRNPLLWTELGQTSLAAGDAKQAESYGRKALSLATGDRRAQSQAAQLTADALRAQGRNQEARAMEKQAAEGAR